MSDTAELIPYAPVETRPRGVTFLELRHRDCRWPMGGPREPAELFCGEPAELGRPYCSGHCAVAYVKPERRR